MITLKCSGCSSVFTVQTIGPGYSEPTDGGSYYCLVCSGMYMMNADGMSGGGGGHAHADGGTAQGGASELNVTPSLSVRSMVVEQLLVPAGASLVINVNVEKQVVVREDTLDMADVDFAVHMARKRKQEASTDDD